MWTLNNSAKGLEVGSNKGSFIVRHVLVAGYVTGNSHCAAK